MSKAKTVLTFVPGDPGFVQHGGKKYDIVRDILVKFFSSSRDDGVRLGHAAGWSYGVVGDDDAGYVGFRFSDKKMQVFDHEPDSDGETLVQLVEYFVAQQGIEHLCQGSACGADCDLNRPEDPETNQFLKRARLIATDRIPDRIDLPAENWIAVNAFELRLLANLWAGELKVIHDLLERGQCGTAQIRMYSLADSRLDAIANVIGQEVVTQLVEGLDEERFVTGYFERPEQAETKEKQQESVVKYTEWCRAIVFHGSRNGLKASSQPPLAGWCWQTAEDFKCGLPVANFAYPTARKALKAAQAWENGKLPHGLHRPPKPSASPRKRLQPISFEKGSAK